MLFKYHKYFYLSYKFSLSEMYLYNLRSSVLVTNEWELPGALI